MKKTFYFIRHGQTDLNSKGIVQGRGIDSPLNDTGRNQADAFHKAYNHIDFDKVYTSTLLRTKQTVAAFTDRGIPAEELEGLDEISWGVYEGQEQNETIMAGFQELVAAWNSDDLDRAVENGESPRQVVERQKIAVQHMLAQADEQTVLVCMHGRALRILLCHLTDTPVSAMDSFPHTNTALYVLEHDEAGFTVVDYYNVEHLNHL